MDIFADSLQISNLTTLRKLYQESKAGFLQLFNNSPICMSMTTTNLGQRRYVKVNQQFLDKFGYSKSEILGKTSTEIGILDEEESIRVGKIIQENGRLHNDYVKCYSKQGRIIHTVSSIELMEMNRDTYLIAFFIDVSQIFQQQAIIKEQMMELKSINVELAVRSEEIEAQKNEIDAINNHLEELVQERTRQLENRNFRIREYAFSNSHIVRGPLARILGLINVLNMQPSLSDEVYPMIQKSALELDEVINEISFILESDV